MVASPAAATGKESAMIAATMFSGIGAPEVAMPLWDWKWHAEIEKFPNAVMAKHHPRSINLGDVNEPGFIEQAEATGRPNVIIFGSPCQSFSVAGRRLGLDDPRGNLALVALGIVNRLKPRWFVFENVPGLLSSEQGRDWGLFLRTVDDIGYCGAWAMLDAQYAGLAQRRERLFFVGHSGDWRGPAAVLFEPESLCGNSPPRRSAGERTAPTIEARADAGGAGWGTDFLAGGGLAVGIGGDAEVIETPDVAWALQERDHKGVDSDTKEGHLLVVADPMPVAFSSKDHGADAGEIAPTLRGMGHDESHANGGGQVAVAFKPSHYTRDKDGAPSDIMPPLTKETDRGDQEPVVFQTRIARNGRGQPEEIVPALNGADAGTTSDMRPCVAQTSAVRRLTPRECERLQGFPDDYTQIEYRGKPAADGPRYKALGNSMAVPVVRWILSRIEAVDKAMENVA